MPRLAAALVALSLTLPSTAAEPRAAAPAADGIEARFLALMRRASPKAPPLQVDSIRPTGVDGVYEVVVGGLSPALVYYLPAREWILKGELHDPAEHKNLTEAALQEARATRLRPIVTDLPLGRAIRVGSGKHLVVEFIDPDCNYSRSTHAWLKARADVTRFIFLAPLAHPGAAAKVAWVLQAADPAAALDRAMSGGLDGDGALGGFTATKETSALAARHLELARGLSLRGTPWFFVDGRTEVSGADTEGLDKALGTFRPRPPQPPQEFPDLEP